MPRKVKLDRSKANVKQELKVVRDFEALLDRLAPLFDRPEVAADFAKHDEVVSLVQKTIAPKMERIAQ